MVNIEKIITGLECCSKAGICFANERNNCPYYTETHDIKSSDCKQLVKDALELLKQQQQQIWELQDQVEYLKDKLNEKKKPIEDFNEFAYKKHFRGEMSAENLAFLNYWISKYMNQI